VVIEALRLHSEVRHVDVYRDAATDALAWAESMTLVYPTWWSSLPAPLLGWVQEGFAVPRPDIRSITAVTTHGSGRLTNTLEGGVGNRLVTRVLPTRCAPGCRTRWIALYDVDRSTPAQRDRFVQRVQRLLTRRPA
jgi:putative NADPH-quinone reductase